MQDLRKQVENEPSLAHIAQAQTEAMNAPDAAISCIEAALKAKTPPPAQSGKPKPSVPAMKSRCVIKTAELMKKPYLETKEDVDAFVKELRERLETAINNHERIQIR